MERKNILITGANRGIGFEIAGQLTKRGFNVILSGRNESKLSEAVDKIRKVSPSAELLLMDISKEDDIKRAAEKLAERNIRIDVLINNAAILLKEDRSLLNQNTEILKTTINTNCYGPLRVIRAFLPLMNNPGKIINISSRGGSMTDPVGGWSPAYCVSKSLLNSMTRHLAYELSGKNITVNAVSPGWVRTDMGGSSAPRSVEKGAETIIWLVTEAPSALTGKFFSDKSEIDY